MTLLEAREIFSYWAESPPTHLAVKTLLAAFGVKRKPGWRQALGDPRAPSRAADAHARLMQAPPPGLAIARGAPRRRSATFDPAELRRRAEAKRDARGG